MEQKRWRILWINNHIKNKKSSDAQLDTPSLQEQAKPYIRFLEYRGYEVSVAHTTAEGMELLQNADYHAVLLHAGGTVTVQAEHPLSQIREVDPHIPLIFVTHETGQETLQQAGLYDVASIFVTSPNGEAPTSPRQLETSLAFVLEKQTAREAYTVQTYAQNFKQLSDDTTEERDAGNDWQTWIETYLRLVQWDLRLDTLHNVDELKTIHEIEKREANAAFASYVQDNYHKWLAGHASPTLSVDVVYKHVIPEIQAGKQVLFVVMDCMRLDHWLKIQPLLTPLFNIKTDYYYSILPTATRYARNAIFSGLFPLEIAERHPDLYAKPDDTSHTSINRYEKDLLRLQFERHGIPLKPPLHYFKIFDTRGDVQYLHWLNITDRVSLAALVVDFLDMLIHTRHDVNLLQQLVPDEAALRSLAYAWFQHSHPYKIFKLAAERGITVVLTSDHGSLLCQKPAKVSSRSELTTGLRFKEGKNIACSPDAAWLIKEPTRYQLPGEDAQKTYLIAKEDYYFVYERQYDFYKEIFQGSFQHGGISLQEMILPCAVLEPR